jgi:hypothetical protein
MVVQMAGRTAEYLAGQSVAPRAGHWAADLADSMVGQMDAQRVVRKAALLAAYWAVS